ncbi:MAG: hypothetical protein ACJAVV_000327 [Alphaproteobacteria bacterium]|jgi:hypothetical protein
MHNKRKKYVFGVRPSNVVAKGAAKVCAINCSIAKHYKSVIAIAVFAFTSATFAMWQEPQTAATSAYECTQVALNDVDEALLTKEERIALLDESLTASIDSYSTCVSSAAQSMSGGGSGKGGGAGSDEENGVSGAQEGVNSSEESTQPNESGDFDQSQNQDDVIPPNSNQAPDNISGKSSTSAPRGIIPPANNDKIICKLLYQEITKTQDADMLKGLKQQYRNYKCG